MIHRGEPLHPYILRIVSLERKTGKTIVGTLLTKSLRSKGIKVAVIKHVGGNIDLLKDTDKYLDSGSDLVIALSSRLIATYSSVHGRTLKEIVHSIPFEYRIILAEGFKRENIGDALAVVKSEKEIQELVRLVPGLIAIISWNPVENREYNGVRIYGFNEIDMITDLIIHRAIEYYYKLLPRIDCGKCGYINCREYIEAYLFEENKTCPLMDRVILKVNGKRIHLTEFVKTVLTNLLVGFITALKGAPNNPLEIKEIELQIRRNKAFPEGTYNF